MKKWGRSTLSRPFGRFWVVTCFQCLTLVFRPCRHCYWSLTDHRRRWSVPPVSTSSPKVYTLTVCRLSACTTSLLGAEDSQIPQIGGQRVAILALQRVVVDNIFYIVDERVQIAFVVFSLAQLSIEVRSAALRVSIALDLLLVFLDLDGIAAIGKARRSLEIILYPSDEIACAHTLG